MLEADTVGFGASGRNGGFALGSLTHGIENGLARFAEEMPQLERLGRENFQGFVADIERLGIDCDLELTGDLGVALEEHELPWIEESAELLARFGHEYEVFDREAVQAEVASPTYLGGIWEKTDAALVDPGKLVAGLAAAALAAGVRIHERTPATKIVDDGAGGPRARPHRQRPRPPRPAGDERLSAAPAGNSPLRRSGLRLRAHDGATHACAARVDRLEAPPGRR